VIMQNSFHEIYSIYLRYLKLLRISLFPCRYQRKVIEVGSTIIWLF